MRATSIIYKRELGAYLRSPFSWILAALVLLVDGILFQALAKNQLIGAIVATVITVLMLFLWMFSKALDSGVIRDVLQELDLWWIHFQNGFMRGVLNLKDIIYYVAVTYFFLLLAVKTLEAK